MKLKYSSAKNAEIGTYGIFSLRSLRSFAAIHFWLRRQPRRDLRDSARAMKPNQITAQIAREKRKADWKKDLQIHGAGGKSRKRPTRVVGQNPKGKSRLKTVLCQPND